MPLQMVQANTAAMQMMAAFILLQLITLLAKW